MQDTEAADNNITSNDDGNISCTSCERRFKPQNFWDLVCTTCITLDHTNSNDQQSVTAAEGNCDITGLCQQFIHE